MLFFIGSCSATQRKLSEYSYNGRRYLYGGAFNGCHPIVSKSGRFLVYSRPSKETLGDILIVNLQDGKCNTIHNNLYYEGEADIAPDDSKIAYISEEHGAAKLFVSDIDGTNKRLLTNKTNNTSEMLPIFSINGKKIAFTRHLANNPDNAFSRELFIINTDGTGEVRITTNSCIDLPVKFSANNKGIYYLSSNDIKSYSPRFQRKYQLLLYDFASKATKVVASGLEQEAATLSKDEKTLYCTEDRQKSYQYEICKRPLTTKTTYKATQLTSLNGYINDIHGNGKYLSFVSEPKGAPNRGIGDIYLYIISSGKLIKLWKNDKLFSAGEKTAIPNEIKFTAKKSSSKKVPSQLVELLPDN